MYGPGAYHLLSLLGRHRARARPGGRRADLVAGRTGRTGAGLVFTRSFCDR
jgi:hypothetical protein